MPIRNRYSYGKVDGIRVGRFNLGINTTFIVYRIGETLIDCGPVNQWRPVKAFIDESPVKTLLLSHHHEDHGGNASRVARYCRLVPFAPELGRAKLSRGYRTPLLQKLVWGSPMPVETQPLPQELCLSDGAQLISLHTPGHAKDMHCFYLPRDGWLFSSDLYLSKSIRYLRSDESLEDLIASIRNVLQLDFEILFCPHRGILENGKQALKAKLENTLSLCTEAQRLFQRGEAIPRIVEKLLGPEDMLARLTNYNFSKRNLISEALRVKETMISEIP